MADKFKIGDVVRLKSGGPIMTVVDYATYGYESEKTYMCKWFDEKKKLSQERFVEEALQRA